MTTNKVLMQPANAAKENKVDTVKTDVTRSKRNDEVDIQTVAMSVELDLFMEGLDGLYS